MNYLVVGLGNIGSEYAGTRHNVGFMVLDAWAKASNIVFRTERYGDVAEVSFKGRNITLLKPSTYMNLSGNAVRYWVAKLKLPLENLIVICDDLNLPFGTLRMRKKGSDGGHNGLKNILQPVMSSVTPLLSHSQSTERKIQVITDYNEVLQGKFQLCNPISDSVSAQVHISRRLEQRYVPSLERNFSHITISFRAENNIGCLCPGIQYHKSYIVSGACILRADISQTDY